MVATELTNCICFFIDEARGRAIELEEVPIKDRGPLHGLPISIKECFQVKGYDMTVGIGRFVDQPAEEDGVFVKTLKV